MNSKVFKNFKELHLSNPEWIVNKNGNTLERPSWGWLDCGIDHFIGLGYYGSEGGYYEDDWTSTKYEGHIPPEGYG